MNNFMETYGKAIFVLVLMAILIAFASPLGIKIKEYTIARVNETDKIGNDDINKTNGKITRPEEPTEAVDKIYCIYYSDGELVISQNKIKPENGRTVDTQGFYNRPTECTKYMKTVKLEGAIKPKSCEKWFCGDWPGCQNLTEIKNIENLYTNECTNMSRMFDGCKSLTSLDLSHFDTIKVTNMSCMFSDCYALTNLGLSRKFNTSNVTNMSQMFYECRKLESIDVSGFDTKNVTNMSNMFYECRALTNLDLSHFDTSKVTTMFNMFSTCRSLVTIDVSHFNTSHVTNMYNMFYYCDKLVNINLSSFNTENVTTMHMMFDECHSLTKLDLSSFNTENVTDMDQMFGYCENLVEVNTSESFLIQENSNLKSMFLNCSNLKKFSCSEETKNKILNSKYRTYAYDKMFVCF